VVPTDFPGSTCFSSSLNTKYTGATTSDITAFSLAVSSTIFHQVNYFENFTISSALKEQALYNGRYLHKLQPSKMTIVTAIHFARKVAHYVPTLAVNGRLIT
jgi:hypothetical protein